MAGNKSCDWSSLPSDIIHLISTKLPDLADLARLHSVCKPWCLAVPLSNPPSCLPWLLERNAADGTDKFCYYSLSSNKTYKIQPAHPQPKDTYYLGEGGVPLRCQGPRSRPLSLFNPLTRLIFFPDEGVCIYYEGLYYINYYGASTWITDTMGETVSYVPCPENRNCPESHQYILESCGEILIILRYPSTKLEDICFSILRLDEVNGEYKWVKVRGIRDRMMFLSEGTGFSLPSSDFSGFKGNCIYFLEDNLEYPTVLLCRHDLEHGTTENLPNFFGNDGTWFFPKFEVSEDQFNLASSFI